MMENGLRKFYWGFLFIMLSFRIRGFDVFPDFVGYILFAIGFQSLSEKSYYFRVASKFNVAMIVLSFFTIYQWSYQSGSTLMAFLGIIMSIITFALNLYVVFNLFMGIRDMMGDSGNNALALEAEERWNQYKLIQIAAVFTLIVAFIPLINFIYILAIIIASIMILFKIMNFIDRCEQQRLIESR